jgi:hypothetical protein
MMVNQNLGPVGQLGSLSEADSMLRSSIVRSGLCGQRATPKDSRLLTLATPTELTIELKPHAGELVVG